MEELLVADSFRVRLNPETGLAEVRGLSLHLKRFSGAVQAAGGPGPVATRLFLSEARDRIASFGEGMPRLELRENAALGLTLRPLPELRSSIELVSAAHLTLHHPERKGPNINVLAELNRVHGVETLLLDEHGQAVEGATTSIVWWRHGALCVIAETRRVPSVTEALLLQAAVDLGTPTDRDAATPAELFKHEAWAVNALHGIRPVTTIDGVRLPNPNPDRLRKFRDALDETWCAVR